MQPAVGGTPEGVLKAAVTTVNPGNYGQIGGKEEKCEVLAGTGSACQGETGPCLRPKPWVPRDLDSRDVWRPQENDVKSTADQVHRNKGCWSQMYTRKDRCSVTEGNVHVARVDPQLNGVVFTHYGW